MLEYPDWVQIVALDANDHLVLVEQYRHGLSINSFKLPTGGAEPSDADAIAADRRELEKETGLQSDDWEHVAILTANPANRNNGYHIVLARNVCRTGTPDDKPKERDRVCRVPIDGAAQLARNGGIAQFHARRRLALALTAIGRWLPSD